MLVALLLVVGPAPIEKATLVATGPIHGLTARGYEFPVTVRYGLYQDRDYIFLLAGASDDVVSRAHAHGWWAECWLLHPGRSSDEISDEDLPPYIPGVPWRPGGTMVLITSTQWQTLGGENDTARLKSALQILAPDPSRWYIDSGPEWSKVVSAKN